jgi:methylated-DNA-[protein]-cysteine S-methyltransferase
MAAIFADRIKTPLGPMALLASNGVLKAERSANPYGLSDKIRAYFDGDLAAIDDIATDGGGSDFESRVWAELRKIPCGTTQSYGAIARRLGDVAMSRAVGLANARNPIAIVVPCHRVIGADGSLTGYGGGLPRKKWLLLHEGAALKAEQGDLFSSARSGS